jgi:hypothetical protein
MYGFFKNIDARENPELCASGTEPKYFLIAVLKHPSKQIV